MKVKRAIFSNHIDADPSRINGFVYRQLRRIGLLNSPAARISDSIRINRYVSGEILFDRGDRITDWTMVVSGLVAKNIVTADNESVPLIIYGIGAWFGEHSILNAELSQGCYQCLSDTVAMQMNEASFRELHKFEVGFNRRINELMAKRYQRISELHTLQKIGTPCMKVVMGIAFVAEALYSELEGDQVVDRITIPVPQAVLASLCSVSRTTLSEFVQKLDQRGWVEANYGRVHVLQIPKWKMLIARYQALKVLIPITDIDEFLRI